MKELKVQPIKNGTVIDHIPSGMALKVLRIIGIDEKGADSTVSVLMHVPSKRTGWKDIVKVEDRELDPKEVDKISLIAPSATINIIRNYEVAEKHKVQLPKEIKGIVKCANPSCITNLNEPVETIFSIKSKSPLKLKCHYCDRELDDVVENII